MSESCKECSYTPVGAEVDLEKGCDSCVPQLPNMDSLGQQE